ncbi:uncharacterized protein BO72DRAFT_41422 [Aspergillus fijiensis CBS 313.89]|uniref:Uncharacterized protein n=1 Tax=Aspergillus fijiensis CBS 313.89 TaxID=1448319 RepID=A0A8G1RXG2_9EURO|nr:uncharacterized protein BO72DRAFT_41422 [Aspergillus fijiensis CBS 313.89]RAK79331.1 hypothetical protein BO72DRAFT_41422 [Aspergillus fijiensis CBS 313.89]
MNILMRARKHGFGVGNRTPLSLLISSSPVASFLLLYRLVSSYQVLHLPLKSLPPMSN